MDPRNHRSRLTELAGSIDRIGEPPTPGARMVGQVYAQISLPTTTGKFFAVHPVTIGGVESEGGSGSFAVDTGSTAYFLVLGPQVPSVGDYLIGHSIDGRWVARKGKQSGGGSVVYTTCAECAAALPPIQVMDSVYGGPTPLVFGGGSYSAERSIVTNGYLRTFTGEYLSPCSGPASITTTIRYNLSCTAFSNTYTLAVEYQGCYFGSLLRVAEYLVGFAYNAVKTSTGIHVSTINCANPNIPFVVPADGSPFSTNVSPYPTGATITVEPQ